jgi:hypothetical protein
LCDAGPTNRVKPVYIHWFKTKKSDIGGENRSKRGQRRIEDRQGTLFDSGKHVIFGNRCGFPRYRSKKECEFLVCVCVSRARVVRQDRPLLLIASRPTNGPSISTALLHLLGLKSSVHAALLRPGLVLMVRRKTTILVLEHRSSSHERDCLPLILLLMLLITA